MSQTVTVMFDGQVLRPESPIELTPNQRYVITIQPDSAVEPLNDGWDEIAALAGTVDASPDWAAEHDHYFYGTPKKTFTDLYFAGFLKFSLSINT